MIKFIKNVINNQILKYLVKKKIKEQSKINVKEIQEKGDSMSHCCDRCLYLKVRVEKTLTTVKCRLNANKLKENKNLEFVSHNFYKTYNFSAFHDFTDEMISIYETNICPFFKDKRRK